MPWLTNPFKKQDASSYPGVLIPLQQVQRYQPVDSTEPEPDHGGEAEAKPVDGPAPADDDDDQPLLESNADEGDLKSLKTEIEKDIPERRRGNPYECL
jgi:hypothetical protein